MKYQRLALCCCAIVLAGLCLCPPVYASPGDGDRVLSCAVVPLYLDAEYLGSGFLLDSITYIPLLTFTEYMLGSECAVRWDQETDTAILSADGLELTVTVGSGYMTVNERCLYFEKGIYNVNGTILVPVRSLAKVFGLGVEWDEQNWTVLLDGSKSCLFPSGMEYYDENDLYWLSRVIFAEAGTQPLSGMIGVGNVVLNRRADESGCFGTTVFEVIFQPGQFDVARYGMIYNEPSEAATVAAKLCLEGYNTVGDSKWFVNPRIGISSWMWCNKTLQCSIADHTFFR